MALHSPVEGEAPHLVKLSLVIISYNCAQYLPEAIDSALAQKVPGGMEIIVVDDASTDQTSLLVQKYQGKITYLRREKNSGGCSAPRNEGIRAAQGEYIALLDSDDFFVNDILVQQVNFLDQNLSVDFVFGDYTNWMNGRVYPPHSLSCPRFRALIKTKKTTDGFVLSSDEAYTALIKENFVGACGMMFRKSLIRKVGFFDENLRSSEDIDFSFRVMAGYPVAFLDVVGFRRRLHENNMTNDDATMLVRKLLVRKRQITVKKSESAQQALDDQIDHIVEVLINKKFQQRKFVEAYGLLITNISSGHGFFRLIKISIFPLTRFLSGFYRAFISFVSRVIFYPLWDLYDRSLKLAELNRLEGAQWEPVKKRDINRFEKISALIKHARETVPFYKNIFLPEFKTWDDLKLFPVLKKDDIRLHKDALISSLYPKGDLVNAKTGGSTGYSLDLFFDKPCGEKRNAAALRSDQWSGWNQGDEIGAVWGNPPQVKTFKQWVRNKLLDRQIFLDTMYMDEDHMHRFLLELQKKRIQFLFGHSHSLFILANFVQMTGFSPVKLKGIISTSMMLLPTERRVIESVFGCPVTNRYGCEEVGLIACECEIHKGLHINDDHLVVEFLRADDSPALPGEEARIILTDLNNYGMPLIRYEVGDVGVLSSRSCECGRTLPLLDHVVGRTADFLIKEDGSLVAGVSLVERTLTRISGISQMQIVQDQKLVFDINVVPDVNFSEDTSFSLVKELKLVFGSGVEIDVHVMDHLPQELNGKYRFAICKVNSRFQPGPLEI